MALRFLAVRFLAILAAVVCAESTDAQTLPPALTNWQVTMPDVLFEGAEGQWDASIRERGWILKDVDQYRMWYTGYDPSRSPRIMKLGYATSTDGVRWTRHADNPVYDKAWTEDMMVVRHKRAFFMFAEGAGDQAQLLTSEDGVMWNRIGALDVRLLNGDPIPAGPYGTPTAWHENGLWYLFYERRDQGIWLATSTDMKVWTNVEDDPVLSPGPEPYDALMIAMNQVVKHDGRYYAVLHGTGTPKKPRDWCTYFAVSDDLRSWKKCSDGPVLPISDNKSSGILVPAGKGFRLYTMHTKVQLHTNQDSN